MAQDPGSRRGGAAARVTPGRRPFRRLWWTAFLAFAVLGTAWNLAMPQWAGTDERAHFLEAQAAWSGQLLPAEDTSAYSEVAVGIMHGMTSPVENSNCFVGDPATSAACLHATRMSHTQGRLLDYVDREPPLPAFLNGWPIAIHPSVLTLYLGRFIDTLIGAAGVATALALVAIRRRPFLFAGVVLGFTPSAVADLGALGTSQLEVGASLVVWVAAALLIDGEPLTTPFVALMAVSSTILALARPVSFVYLGLAVLSALVLSRRETLRALAQSHAARIAALVTGAVTVFSLAWAAFAEGRPGSHVEHLHIAPLPGLGDKLNFFLSTVPSHWIQSIGTIGANDYYGPWWTTIGWTMLLGVTVGAGLLWAGRRRIVVVGLLGAALLALPLVVEVTKANTERLTWQGRYDIPTIAGIVLISCGPLDRALVTTPPLRRLATAVISVAGLLQVIEFLGSLRRYAVGIDGPLDPRHWVNGWHPPIPMPALVVFGVLAVTVTYALLGLQQRAVLAGVDRSEVSADRETTAGSPSRRG